MVESLGATERSKTSASRAIGRTNLLVGTIGATACGQLATALSGIASARALGIEDRGHLALLMLVPVMLVQLGGMGVPNALPYFIARGGTLRALPRRTSMLALAQALAIMLACAGVFAALVADNEPMLQVAALLTIPAAPAWLLQQYELAALQGQSRFAAYNVLRALPATLYAVAAVALFAIGVHSLGLFSLAWSLAAFVGFVAATVVRRRSPGRPAAREGVRALLSFGLRSLPAVASPIEMLRFDQAFVGVLLSPYDLGLYVVALAFTTLPRLLAFSVGAIAYPRLASTNDVIRARNVARETVVLTTALCLVVSAVLFAAAPYLVELLFGEEFSGAGASARILLVGAFLGAVRRIVGDVARGLGKPGVASLGEIASVASALPLIAFLLPSYGVEGVALALTLAAGLSLIVVLVRVRRDPPFPRSLSPQ